MDSDAGWGEALTLSVSKALALALGPFLWAVVVMACFYPVDAWKAQRLNESGKRSLVFSRRDGFEDMALQVPCGKCQGCLADRAREWAVRMYHEASLHDRNCFVTLTYSDPPPPTINKKHLQDFFKRLRHDYRFRYVACGEYGDATRRPHYHAVFFGVDFLAGSIPYNDQLYLNTHLESVWGHGSVLVGPISMEVCCYVAGYVMKKVGDPDSFRLQSSRPGIGHDWLDKYGDDLRRTGSVTIDGKEFPIPKRYLVWHEDELTDVKRDRLARFLSRSADDVWNDRVSLPHKEAHAVASRKLKAKKI